MKKIFIGLLLIISSLFAEYKGNINLMIAGQVVGNSTFEVIANENNVPYIYFYAPDKTILFVTYFNTKELVMDLAEMLVAYDKQVKILKMLPNCKNEIYELFCENNLGWEVGTLSSDECTYIFTIYVKVKGIEYFITIPNSDLSEMGKEVARIFLL